MLTPICCFCFSAALAPMKQMLIKPQRDSSSDMEKLLPSMRKITPVNTRQKTRINIVVDKTTATFSSALLSLPSNSMKNLFQVVEPSRRNAGTVMDHRILVAEDLLGFLDGDQELVDNLIAHFATQPVIGRCGSSLEQFELGCGRDIDFHGVLDSLEIEYP